MEPELLSEEFLDRELENANEAVDSFANQVAVMSLKEFQSSKFLQVVRGACDESKRYSIPDCNTVVHDNLWASYYLIYEALDLSAIYNRHEFLPIIFGCKLPINFSRWRRSIFKHVIAFNDIQFFDIYLRYFPLISLKGRVESYIMMYDKNEILDYLLLRGNNCRLFHQGIMSMAFKYRRVSMIDKLLETGYSVNDPVTLDFDALPQVRDYDRCQEKMEKDAEYVHPSLYLVKRNNGDSSIIDRYFDNGGVVDRDKLLLEAIGKKDNAVITRLLHDGCKIDRSTIGFLSHLGIQELA